MVSTTTPFHLFHKLHLPVLSSHSLYYTANNAFTDTYEYLEDYMQQMTAMGNTCQIYESNGVYYTLTHWWYGHHEIRAFYMMDGYVLTIHGRTTEYSEEIPALIDYVTSGNAQ